MAGTAEKLIIPPRVAIIMDGNGRWATRRGLKRIDGHAAGERSVGEAVLTAVELKMEALALYAFSTENWTRPKEEVDFLMHFNREILDKRVDEWDENNVKVRFLGRRRPIPGFVLRKIDNTVERTSRNTGLKLNICFNYGGKQEIVDAVRQIAGKAADGKIKPGRISAKTIEKHLYVPDVPEYDLMIRTSGEMRTSNFLPWQTAYAELVFTPVLWPDFRREDFLEAIEEYNRRTRTFGGLQE